MSAEEIKAFAAEFDPQPMHLDEEAARAGMMGGLCASGWHSCAIMMRIIADGLDLLCVRLGDGSLVWKAERGDGDLYFAGVAEGKALVVGKTGLRALDADTGKAAWTLAVGEPSGVGATAEGVYYLPLRKTAAVRQGLLAVTQTEGWNESNMIP